METTSTEQCLVQRSLRYDAVIKAVGGALDAVPNALCVLDAVFAAVATAVERDVYLSKFTRARSQQR